MVVAQRIERVGTEPVQAGDLARHALVGVVLTGFGETGENLRAALGDGRVSEVDPHLAVADLDRVGAQSLATVQVPAASQVELPVVPVAGEDAPLVEAALAQRIALVRATVVAGKYAVRGVEPTRSAAPPCGTRDGPSLRGHRETRPWSMCFRPWWFLPPVDVETAPRSGNIAADVAASRRTVRVRHSASRTHCP